MTNDEQIEDGLVPVPESPSMPSVESAPMDGEVSPVPSEEPVDIEVESARTEAPLVAPTEERQAIRLLIFTKDASIVKEGSPSYQRIADGTNLFLETHVVLITPTEKKKDIPPFRPFQNVWIYPVPQTWWWKSIHSAYRLAVEQLSFGGGFRADIIIADDPFEAGLAGWFLSKKFDRAFQVHLVDDFYDESFVEFLPHPLLYTWSTEYILGRAHSIRTRTEPQRQEVISLHKKQEAVTEVLPSYYNLKAWSDFVPTESLHDLYPQFKFTILHVSLMNARSHTAEIIRGVAQFLRRYPTVGLVIVGNGPLRSVLERLVIALGIQKQVEFRPMPTEIISFMKSASVLVHLSENAEEDEVILQAAAVRLPMIANAEGLAGRLFVDNESACLCAPTDSECVGNRLNQYLNENQDRTRFALNAYNNVFERVEQDYGGYLEAYRESIERGLSTTKE